MILNIAKTCLALAAAAFLVLGETAVLALAAPVKDTGAFPRALLALC